MAHIPSEYLTRPSVYHEQVATRRGGIEDVRLQHRELDLCEADLLYNLNALPQLSRVVDVNHVVHGARDCKVEVSCLLDGDALNRVTVVGQTASYFTCVVVAEADTAS